jgi:2-methylcitrate dehydratase
LGVAQFCVDALWSDDPARRLNPSQAVLDRTGLFYQDAVGCGLSAIALLGHEGLGAMRVLALERHRMADPQASSLIFGAVECFGATIYGSSVLIDPAVAAGFGGFAVRAWDANGTSFAYRPSLGHVEGEFGHNDFYDSVVSAAQMVGQDGLFALRAMVLVDEIRERLGSVYSLKNRHIDHVFHGGIAVAFVVGAILQLKPEQIEQAVGVYVAHYVPTRANRAGDETISDSKGAAAGIAAQAAFDAVLKVRQGFVGPTDIFRIQEGIFRLLGGPGVDSKTFGRGDGRVPAQIESKPSKVSPFDLVLTREGDDFAIMGMHIKLALYEHQSAGALAGLLLALRRRPELIVNPALIKRIKVRIYNPAFDIISQPARRDPKSREAADHSMFYLVARLLRKVLEAKSVDWATVMLDPRDFAESALHDSRTRELMKLIDVEYAPEFDGLYPEGIPTQVLVTATDDQDTDSGRIMFPPGHARYDGVEFGPFDAIFRAKLALMAVLAFGDSEKGLQVLGDYGKIGEMSARQLAEIHSGYEIPDRSSLMS